MIIEIAFAASQHLLPGDFNERHLSARLAFDSGAFATVYHNSEDAVSFGVGYNTKAELSDSWSIFGEAALVTGYDYAPVRPLLRGGLEYDDRYRLWIAPAEDTNGETGVVFGAEVVIGQW